MLGFISQNGLEVLRNRKNARYNKQWIVDLKKMFTVRSYNLEKCDGRCYIKSDSSKCIREANDRFICSWTALLQDIRKEVFVQQHFRRIFLYCNKIFLFVFSSFFRVLKRPSKVYLMSLTSLLPDVSTQTANHL